jgi:hypothetical protein
MRFLSTRTHGLIDYLTAAALIVLPWVLNFHSGTSLYFSTAAGVLILGVSLLTDYERGLVPVIPMTGHLGADIGLGMFMIVTPLAMSFPPNAWIPLLIIGASEMVVPLITRLYPSPAYLASAHPDQSQRPVM